MPRPQALLNGFTSKDLHRITGLSGHMVSYLTREGYLEPSYRDGKRARGRVRYYSYRDLVVARIVQHLLSAGVEIRRLKEAIQRLSASSVWLASGRDKALRVLVTDGKNIFYPDPSGALIEVTESEQMAFAFVLDVGRATAEVKSNLTAEQLHHFSFKNRAIKRVPAGSG